MKLLTTLFKKRQMPDATVIAGGKIANIIPCFVYVGDRNKRHVVCSKLEQIGYRICRCALYEDSDYIDASFVERNIPNDSGYEIHGIPNTDDDSGYSIDLVKLENSKDQTAIDCGDNVELFMALCGIREGVLQLYSTEQIIEHFQSKQI